jgi:hypothetical protein
LRVVRRNRADVFRNARGGGGGDSADGSGIFGDCAAGFGEDCNAVYELSFRVFQQVVWVHDVGRDFCGVCAGAFGGVGGVTGGTDRGYVGELCGFWADSGDSAGAAGVWELGLLATDEHGYTRIRKYQVLCGAPWSWASVSGLRMKASRIGAVNEDYLSMARTQPAEAQTLPRSSCGDQDVPAGSAQSKGKRVL